MKEKSRQIKAKNGQIETLYHGRRHQHSIPSVLKEHLKRSHKVCLNPPSQHSKGKSKLFLISILGKVRNWLAMISLIKQLTFKRKRNKNKKKGVADTVTFKSN